MYDITQADLLAVLLGTAYAAARRQRAAFVPLIKTCIFN